VAGTDKAKSNLLARLTLFGQKQQR